MKKFFTISQFAELRNININSLRYYEKLGILVPEYVDPQTKYRYYAAEQLIQLDIIKLAIDLEIPLKSLKGDGGITDNRALFEESKEVALARIKEMQLRLARIDYSLHMLGDIENYVGIKGIYRRTISARTILAVEYSGSLENVNNVSKATNKVVNYAKKNDIPIVFPMGVILRYTGDEVRQYIGFHAISSDYSGGEFEIFNIGEGQFDCLQKETDVDGYRVVADSAFSGYGDRMVLVFAVTVGSKTTDLVEFQVTQC